MPSRPFLLYDYFPEELQLTLGETEEYGRLTARLAFLRKRLEHQLDLPKESRILTILTTAKKLGLIEEVMGLTALLQQRADISKKAAAKIPFAANSLKTHASLKRVLVYCDDNEQLGEVEQELRKGAIPTVRYVGEMDEATRNRSIKAIEGGVARAVLSMRCLDEGVDLPSCDGALILASSKTWREFVQRRAVGFFVCFGGRLTRR